MTFSYIKCFMLLIPLCTLFSCTKEISVDVAHEPQIVIFGELTNLNKNVSITIQQSVSLKSPDNYKPVNDAIIVLYEKKANGNTNEITRDFSVNQGTYVSAHTIATTIGNSYWVTITLNDGSVYNSAEETMLPVVKIENVEMDDKYADVLNVKFSDPKTATNFYQLSLNLLNQDKLVSSNFTESNDVVFDGNKQASIEIDLFRNNGNDDRDHNFPGFDMMEIGLANINFSSYQFLLNQRAQIKANEDAEDSSGGDPSQLFSTPPVSLIGNITSKTTNKKVLGNFSVKSISIRNRNS